MLYLRYRFKLTDAADNDLSTFWMWTQEREEWFYDGLDTVVDTHWYVRIAGVDVHMLEHIATFADEASWGRYRVQVAQRGRDPIWERRRVEQNHWWTLQSASILSDPPVPLGLNRSNPALSESLGRETQ